MTDNEQIDEMMYAAEIEQQRHEEKPEEDKMTAKESSDRIKETIAEYEAYRRRMKNGADANCADEYKQDCRDYERQIHDLYQRRDV